MSTVGEDYDLSGDDVSIVVEILTPVSFKWEEIAIALNLPVVAKMQCRNPMHIIALTNVLNAWWSIKDKKHTLGQLRKAIAGPIVGHGRLAGKLISEFNKAKESIEEPLTSDSEVLNTAAAKGVMLKDSKKISRFIKDGKKIKRKTAHIMVIGYPGNGKSHLLDNLLDRRRGTYSSTGISDSVVVVDVAGKDTTSHTTVTGCGSSWTVNSFNDLATTQLQQCYKLAAEPDENQLQQFEEQAPISEIPQQSLATTSESTDSLQHAIFRVLQQHKTSYADLTSSFSLYIRDTGGQVEFQEVLSILINGPSIFFFVIKANLSLDEPLTLEYRDGEDVINCYESTTSTRQALVQTLTTIQSIDKLKNVDTQHESTVFIIGTHIDKIEPSEFDEEIKKLNYELHSLIDYHEFTLVEYKHEESQTVFFPVSNTDRNPENFKAIRKKVYQIIEKTEIFSIPYPLGYLLFSLELQRCKDDVLTRTECEKIAAKFMITTDEEVTDMLKFLHHRIGIIQYYDTNQLKDLVIKEPQVLFNKLTDLMVKTFLSPSETFIHSTKNDVIKGIIKATTLKNTFKACKKIVQYFIAFIEHLRIAAPFKQGEDKYFFIPSAINHLSEKRLSEVAKSKVCSLVIMFNSSCCPKGVFGMTICHFMSRERKDNQVTFSLEKKSICRDLVCFKVYSSESYQGKVFLSVQNSKESSQPFCRPIEVRFCPIEDASFKALAPLCNQIRTTLKDGIQHSLTQLNYSESRVGTAESLICHLCQQIHKKETNKRDVIVECEKKGGVDYPKKCCSCWFSEALTGGDESKLPIERKPTNTEGEESRVLKKFSSKYDDLKVIFTFDQNWLANELYDRNLIDSDTKNDVKSSKSHHNKYAKADLIYSSVLDHIKVKVNQKENIARLKEVLKMKEVYKDGISLLFESGGDESQLPVERNPEAALESPASIETESKKVQEDQMDSSQDVGTGDQIKNSDSTTNFIDYKKIIYRNEEKEWNFEEHNFCMIFKPDSLPADIADTVVEISITSGGNDYILPKDYVPVSAFFSIKCQHKFRKPVVVSIEHFSAEKSDLSFVVSSNPKPPLHFELLDGGKFIKKYGLIERCEFSILGIVTKLLTGRWPDMEYYFALYTSPPVKNIWTVFIYVMKESGTNRHRIMMDANHSDSERMPNVSTVARVTHTINHFTVDISLNDDEISHGWQLPLNSINPIKIPRNRIDNCRGVPTPANFKIILDVSNSNTLCDLSHNFEIADVFQENSLTLSLSAGPTSTAARMPTSVATPMATSTTTQMPSSAATQMPSSSVTQTPTSAATQMQSSAATQMQSSTATQMPTSVRVVEDSGTNFHQVPPTNSALQSSESIAMDSETVQEGQEDCACDQHTPDQSKAYAMSKYPCHPLKLNQCRKYLNGEGVKIAIIDEYEKQKTTTYHQALLKNDGSLKIRLVDTTNGNAQEIHADKKTNVVISDHALQCTSIAVGEKVDGFFIYKEKLHKYSFPGGVAPKADATLYLVDHSNRDSVLLALKEIINEESTGRKKFDVLSMSFGSVRNCYYKRELYEVLKTNTIVVVAGANCGNALLSCTAKLVDQPGFRYQSLISVGGIDCYSNRAQYSPKNVIISQMCEFLAPISDNNGILLKFTAGTSMSTPAVAGIICLLIQIGKQHGINPLTKNEIIRLLKKSIKGEAETIEDGCYNQEFLELAFENGKLFKDTVEIIELTVNENSQLQ